MESSHDHHVNICNANHILVPGMHVQEVQFMLLLPWMMSWVQEQGWLLKLGQQKWRQIWAKRAPCRVPHTCIVRMHKGHAGGGTHVMVKNHQTVTGKLPVQREAHMDIKSCLAGESASYINFISYLTSAYNLLTFILSSLKCEFSRKAQKFLTHHLQSPRSNGSGHDVLWTNVHHGLVWIAPELHPLPASLHLLIHKHHAAFC
jgi:hypothetical protein